jgi:hypothetical protein
VGSENAFRESKTHRQCSGRPIQFIESARHPLTPLSIAGLMAIMGGCRAERY